MNERDMSDTPRTDEFLAGLSVNEYEFGEAIRYAKTLERELAAVTKERDALRVCFAEASHNAGPAFVAHETLNRYRAALEEIAGLSKWIRSSDIARGALSPP